MEDKKYCATCGFFENDATDGSGLCALYNTYTSCEAESCKKYNTFFKCAACKWDEEFKGICMNSKSKYYADYTPYLTDCECFER